MFPRYKHHFRELVLVKEVPRTSSRLVLFATISNSSHISRLSLSSRAFHSLFPTMVTPRTTAEIKSHYEVFQKLARGIEGAHSIEDAIFSNFNNPQFGGLNNARILQILPEFVSLRPLELSDDGVLNLGTNEGVNLFEHIAQLKDIDHLAFVSKSDSVHIPPTWPLSSVSQPRSLAIQSKSLQSSTCSFIDSLAGTLHQLSLTGIKAGSVPPYAGDQPSCNLHTIRFEGGTEVLIALLEHFKTAPLELISSRVTNDTAIFTASILKPFIPSLTHFTLKTQSEQLAPSSTICRTVNRALAASPSLVAFRGESAVLHFGVRNEVSWQGIKRVLSFATNEAKRCRRQGDDPAWSRLVTALRGVEGLRLLREA